LNIKEWLKMSNYNMEVVESNFKSMRSAGIKFKVVAQKSDVDMIWEVEKAGIKKLVFIHEGKMVAGINV
jgi:hypothetical protein